MGHVGLGASTVAACADLECVHCGNLACLRGPSTMLCACTHTSNAVAFRSWRPELRVCAHGLAVHRRMHTRPCRQCMTCSNLKKRTLCAAWPSTGMYAHAKPRSFTPADLANTLGARQGGPRTLHRHAREKSPGGITCPADLEVLGAQRGHEGVDVVLPHERHHAAAPAGACVYMHTCGRAWARHVHVHGTHARRGEGGSTAEVPPSRSCPLPPLFRFLVGGSCSCSLAMDRAPRPAHVRDGAAAAS